MHLEASLPTVGFRVDGRKVALHIPCTTSISREIAACSPARSMDRQTDRQSYVDREREKDRYIDRSGRQVDG